MAANGEKAGRTAIARLLMLCTVLLGLLLMHGNPVAVAGCHDGMPLSAMVSADAPMTLAHSADPMPSTAVQAPSAGAGAPDRALVSVPRTSADSEVCVSTQARGGVALPGSGTLSAGLLVTVAAATGLTVRADGRLADGRRAPPRNGRDLLLQVCIART